MNANHFDVFVLGPFALFRDGVPIESAGWQRKVQTLFRILTSAPERRRSREELADLLWPEASAEAGARNLRVVLHMLRRGLGGGEPSPVLSEQGWIVLNPAFEWEIDLVRFERGIAAAGNDRALLEEAIGTYRGEPLPEERYEDWAIAVRSRVQRTWREACLRLARLERERGAPEAAIGWLDRVLEGDPLDEEAVVRVLQVLGDLGRRTEALRRYAAFAQRLREDMDLAPSQETESVVTRIRTEAERKDGLSRAESVAPDDTAPAPHPIPIIPRCSLPVDGRLFGREPELGRILWTLPPLHAAAPRLAMVMGEAGMGKTRLLAEVAARARRAGLLSLAGAAYVHEGGLPYGALRDALSDYLEDQPKALIEAQLGAYLAALSSIAPELRWRFPLERPTPADGIEDRRLPTFLALTRSLDRIAQDMPLVLLLDDLQWADELTVQALHFLVRRGSTHRMLVVAAATCSDAGDQPPAVDAARELELAGLATVIRLGPLSREAVRFVVEERVRERCDDSLIDGIFAASGGNPVRALQQLRSARES